MSSHSYLTFLGIIVIIGQIIFIAYVANLFPLSFINHTTTLSDRASAFYEEQKPSNLIWRHRNLIPEPEKPYAYLNPTGILSINSPCASVTIPFKAKNPQVTQSSSHRCNIRASIQEPIGNVTITIDQFPLSSIDNNSHVILRQNDPDTYKPFTLSLKTNLNQVYAFQTDTEITLFAETPTQHITVSFSNLSPTDLATITSQKFSQLVDSITISQDFISQAKNTPRP